METGNEGQSPLGKENGHVNGASPFDNPSPQNSGNNQPPDGENLLKLVVQFAHLLPAEKAQEYNALILNTPYGAARYRIGLLKPLSPDVKRSLSRLLGVYSTAENVIQYQILDGSLFQKLMAAAYAKNNVIKNQKREHQQQTRETRIWNNGDDSANSVSADKYAPLERASVTIEDLAGRRLDISNLETYYELKKQFSLGLLRESDLDTLDFVKFLFQDFILSGASDLHIEATRYGGRIRYRFQGKPYTRFDRIPPPMYQKIANSICILGGKDTSRMKQVGIASVIKLTARIDGEVKPVEFRFQSSPTLHNPSVVIRGQPKPMTDINQLGFLPPQLDELMSAISNDRGIVVVTGPTGSGKTNTLNCIATILEEGDDLVIIELGSPIEIESERRKQITMPETPSEAQNEIIRAMFFMDALRSDPDVLIYTEIRSVDETRTAFRAAVTGHLVFTTFHAADVEETIARLFEMNIDRPTISKGILAIVAQTLIRKLCEHCRQIDEEATALAANGATIYRENPVGCAECDAGYKGRTVIAEVLRFNEGVQKMINAGYKPADIAKAAVENGWMMPMKRVALTKLNSGATSESEVKNIIGLQPRINPNAARLNFTSEIDFSKDFESTEANLLEVE